MSGVINFLLCVCHFLKFKKKQEPAQGLFQAESRELVITEPSPLSSLVQKKTFNSVTPQHDDAWKSMFDPIDVSGKDFSGKTITWDLLGQDKEGFISYVDFTDANLSGCNFTQMVRLSNVDFTRADLFGADFTRVQLVGATFTDAYTEHNYHAREWEDEGLMPTLADGSVLVWKHVTEDMVGNLAYPYELGKQFECASMATAGPMGALRNWNSGDPNPHILAVAAHALYDYSVERGIYYAFRGTPLALYRADNIDRDGCDFVRIAGTPGDGVDPIGLLMETEETESIDPRFSLRPKSTEKSIEESLGIQEMPVFTAGNSNKV